MGLLPLRGPPKPQPCEDTKRFVRRCRSLFSSVLLSGAQGGSLSASHTNHPFCAARCLPGRRRSGRANDFYSFSSGQTACRKSCAFAPGCRRTGLSARSPHTAALGGRFALHASALALRGIAGLFQMKKGRLRAKSRAFSAGGPEALRRSDTRLRARSPPLFCGIRRVACTLLRKDAWLRHRQLFSRTFLFLLCLFRPSEKSFLFNRHPDFAGIVGVVHICRGIRLKIRSAAGLIFTGREKFAAYLLVKVLKCLRHSPGAGKYNISVGRNVFYGQSRIRDGCSVV